MRYVLLLLVSIAQRSKTLGLLRYIDRKRGIDAQTHLCRAYFEYMFPGVFSGKTVGCKRHAVSWFDKTSKALCHYGDTANSLFASHGTNILCDLEWVNNFRIFFDKNANLIQNSRVDHSNDDKEKNDCSEFLDIFNSGFDQYISLRRGGAQSLCTGTALLAEFKQDQSNPNAVQALLATLEILVRVPSPYRPSIAKDDATERAAGVALNALHDNVKNEILKRLNNASNSGIGVAAAILHGTEQCADNLLNCINKYRENILAITENVRPLGSFNDDDSLTPRDPDPLNSGNQIRTPKETDGISEVFRDILQFVTANNEKWDKNAHERWKKEHLANVLTYFVAIASRREIPPHSSTFQYDGKDDVSVNDFFKIS